VKIGKYFYKEGEPKQTTLLDVLNVNGECGLEKVILAEKE
jgi:hypothetical protein